MIYLPPMPLIWAAVIVAAYVILSRGLFLAMEKVRQGLIDRAAELTADARFPKTRHAHIFAMLDSAHSASTAWRLAFSAMWAMFVLPFQSDRGKKRTSELPEDLEAKLCDLEFRFLASAIANSLGAALIFGLGFVISVAFRVSIRMFTQVLSSSYGSHSDIAKA